MKTELVTTLKRQATRIVEGIARGEKAIIDGDIFSHNQAKERMRKWLK